MEPHGPVCDEHCSHNQTSETLTALGFPVKQVDHVVGTPVVTREGQSLEHARHAAWEAGKIRLCTRTLSATQFGSQ